MSESQEAVSVERFPVARAEAMFLILKNGPMTTEQMRQSLGYGTHAGWAAHEYALPEQSFCAGAGGWTMGLETIKRDGECGFC